MTDWVMAGRWAQAILAAIVSLAGCHWTLCDRCPDGSRCVEGKCVVDLDDGATCEIACGARVCGPDPACGASCGACGTGTSCNVEGSCEPHVPWVLTAGGSGYGTTFGNSIAASPEGGYFVTGGFYRTATFGSDILRRSNVDFTDGFIARVAADGTFEWASQFGVEEGNDSGVDVKVDDDGMAYLVGMRSGKIKLGTAWLPHGGGLDGYVAKLSPDNKTWQSLGLGAAGSELCTAVATDADGNLYVVGSFQGTFKTPMKSVTLTSRGAWDIFVVKLDPQFVVQWATSGGGTSSDRSWRMALDASGVYILAFFEGTATFGQLTCSASGQDDIMVLKISRDGKPLWARSAGGPDNDVPGGIGVTRAGDVLISGSFASKASFGGQVLTSKGTSDIFVAKLSPAGEYLWARSFGGAGDDSGEGLAIAPDGAIYLAGGFQQKASFDKVTLTSNGEGDIFVARLSSAGEVQWVRSAGGKTNDLATAVTVGPDGLPCVTGHFSNHVLFDGTAVDAGNTSDLFVWHVVPPK